MRIVFVQHAHGLGGSVMSLLLTVQGLKERGHDVVVVLARPTQDVAEYYRRHGIETVPYPLVCWDHSTVAPRPLWNPWYLGEIIGVALGWRRSKRRTLDMVRTLKPDIVHLNSMPLSASAMALAEAQIPFVWHVREPAPDLSWRTRVIGRIMAKCPALIFIAKHDQQSWGQTGRGVIIRNFVDFRRFDHALPAAPRREALRIPAGVPVILYVGAMATAKGWRILLLALAELRKRGVPFVAVLPGTQWQPPATWKGRVARKILPWFGGGLPIQLFERELERLGLGDCVRRLSFESRIEQLYAAADLVVFPATAPHFARPVIEAAAMGKPAVGSDLGGVNELIDHGRTGILVPPSCPDALADALEQMCVDTNRRETLGRQAHETARGDYSASTQIDLICRTYDSVLEAAQKNVAGAA